MGFYYPKDGEILFGPFAKDLSPHNAVILHVIDKKVYLFPISSRENTLAFYNNTDSAAVVELTREEKESIFRDKAKPISFIYCGKRNIITKSIVELQVLVEKKEAFVRPIMASQDLMERIVFGVYNSRTNDEETIKSILGSVN